jgi:uncharacterized protein
VKAADWQGNLGDFEKAEASETTVGELWGWACSDQRHEFHQALAAIAGATSGLHTQRPTDSRLDALATRPGTVAWSRAILAMRDGRPVHAVDGAALHRDDGYLGWLQTQGTPPGGSWEIHGADPWLKHPFGQSIYFESPEAAARAVPVLDHACRIISAWRPALASEMMRICKAVQFVRDPSAHPDKIVSFSDNSVPGALFVSVYRGDSLIDPYDLADSLIHESRHQKLYLLERVTPLVAPTTQKVMSPWREELRPPSGLFHAVFVFIELRRFWRHVLANGGVQIKARATSQLDDTQRNLAAGFATLAQCPLTKAGRDLAAVLEAEMAH